MKYKTLGEICNFAKKSKRKAGDGLAEGIYPFYTSSNVQRKFFNESDYTEDSLILGTGGLASIHYCSKKFSCTADCMVLEPSNNDFFAKYIYYYLSGNLNILEDGFRGAGLKHISKEYVEKIKIPLLPLETQKQIAEVLDKSDELRQKRKLANQKLDEFLQSTFLDMFGDPMRNPKGWEFKKFGSEISTLTDYHANGSYEILRDYVSLYKEPQYALMVRTTDLENNNFTEDVNYITEKAYNFLEKSKVYGGEIIINKIGSAGKVYLMPYLNRPVSLGMNAFLLRFTKNVNVLYLYHLLTSNYGAGIIQKKVQGAVTKTITKEAVRDLNFPIPPIDLQNQFAKIVEKVEEQKAKNEAQTQKLDDLFNSLLQRAFKGELQCQI